MTRNKRCPSPALTECPGRERSGVSALLLAAAVVLAGCPSGGGGGGASDFDRGFDEGFAKDAPYNLGYADSWRTFGFDSLYQGNLYPEIGDGSFQAGLNEGQFTAYSDGFFVAYSYAFIIGFSEGYDNGFWDDYAEFLAWDKHYEFRNGGFDDGYHDGFSEGRIFGAFDFKRTDFPFDWLDALIDWELGTDLFLAEVGTFGLGTGPWSPVTLYEYGAAPALSQGPAKSRGFSSARTVRGTKLRAKAALEFARPLTVEQEDELRVVPVASFRDDRVLALETTWLQRIYAYNNAPKSSAKQVRRSRTPLATTMEPTAKQED